MKDPKDAFGKKHGKRVQLIAKRKAGESLELNDVDAKVVFDAEAPDFDRSKHGISILEALAATGLRSIR